MSSISIKDVLIASIMFIPGFLVTFFPYINLIKVKKKYEKTKGVCVDVNVSRGDDSTMYQPVWEYYYGSQKYTSAMNSEASFMNIPIGTEKIVYVNPDNPLKIYVPFMRSFVFTSLVGSVFLFFGIAYFIQEVIR